MIIEDAKMVSASNCNSNSSTRELGVHHQGFGSTEPEMDGWQDGNEPG
jgi:hypothetical protein